jgi:hypothetical protein
MEGRRRSMEGWSDFLTYYDAPPTHCKEEEEEEA